MSKSVPVIFVAGEGANDIGLQSGGWTLQWQGLPGNINEGTTILGGIRALARSETRVEFNRDADFSELKTVDGKRLVADVGIVVLAEQPYSEGIGDAADISLTDRYFQQEVRAPSKLVPEGVEGRVPHRGPLSNSLYQLLGGVRSGMGLIGAPDLAALRARAEFVRISAAGLRESHPHDVIITEEPPNYWLESK